MCVKAVFATWTALGMVESFGVLTVLVLKQGFVTRTVLRMEKGFLIWTAKVVVLETRFPMVSVLVVSEGFMVNVGYVTRSASAVVLKMPI